MRPLHLHGVALVVSVTDDRAGAAARFNQDVRQEHAGVDLHRRDVRHVNGLLLPARSTAGCAERRWWA